MKKVFIFCAAALCTNALFAQTLFSYGKNETSKTDFLRAYNKNKPSTADKEKAMREYLDLYTNFKLKVKAAQELRLDTISQIKYDVQNFREQVLENYLSDEKGMQLLINEAMERSTKDVHILYFLVPVSSEAKPADTLKSLNAAKELYNNLKKANSNLYNEMVADVTTKFTPTKYADVGFVTAFSVPYEFENIIYNTKIGDVSEPYRTNKGWVIFKVIEDRPSIGKWKLAQILFAYPPNADVNTKSAIKAKADSVYALVKEGLGFAEAAKKFSDDRMTYLSGGEIQEFGTGKFNNVFEENVIALKKDNDFGKPFETSFGYHIVKRLTHTPVPTDKTDGSYQFETKQKVTQDSRINSEREKFAKDVMQKTGFKKLLAINDKILFASADSILTNPIVERISSLPISKKVIASFKDGTQIKGSDWLNYMVENKPNGEQPKQSNNVMWDRFSKQAVINYYKKHLEEYNADFKYQMQEFKEGNMLFEIMERNVWSKAGTDSMSLKKYYEAHKENYKWTASADVLIFNCATEKLATEALVSSKAGKTWATIAETSNSQIQADSGRYEVVQIPGVSASTKIFANTFSDITKNADGSASFVKYLKLYDSNMHRSFAEARGLVINDYQNVLEQQWVEELRKKYPVKVNEVVFKEMMR
jgi:peptidyl-prolyl cis-trans isomerase SurA